MKIWGVHVRVDGEVSDYFFKNKPSVDELEKFFMKEFLEEFNYDVQWGQWWDFNMIQELKMIEPHEVEVEEND